MNVIATTITGKIDERKRKKYVYPYFKRQLQQGVQLQTKSLKVKRVHNGKQ